MKFDKVKSKKAKTNRKKWWIIKTKNYVIPLYLLPIALVVIPFHKLENLIESKSLRWSNERADKVLNKYLLKALEWDEEAKEYSKYIRSFGNWYYSKSMPFGHRKWAWKHHHTLKEYLLEKYENPNYTKTVKKEDDEWYEIIFKEKA